MEWLKSRKGQQNGDRGDSDDSKQSRSRVSKLLSRTRTSRGSSSVREAVARDQPPPTEAGVPEAHSKVQEKKQANRDLWSAAFEQLDSSKRKTLEESSASVGQSGTNVSVVGHIITQTQEAYEDYKKKGLRIQRGKGKDEINVRDEAKKLLSVTLDVKSLIDSAVRSDPTGYASTAWTIVSFGLQLAQNDQDRLDRLFKSSAFLANLLARYANIEAHYLDHDIKDVDRLENAIIDVYTAILDYAAEVRSTREQNALKRSIVAFQALAGQPLQLLQEAVLAKDKEVEAWRSLVSHEYRQKECEESIEKADIMLDEIDRMAADVLTIKKAVITKEREQLLQCISSINVSDSYNRSLNRREEGTGKWLLNSTAYKDWRANAPSFFWLHGTSGCGKTILCTTIIKDLEGYCSDSRHALAYWYFDFNDTNKQVVDHMLSSIIRQLAAAAKELPQEISALADGLRGSGRQPETRKLFSALNSVIKSIDKEIFVVIDALDECPQKADHANRQDLLNQIVELLSEQNRNLHLIATSRKEVDIQESLQAVATAKLDIQTAFRGDIELFVKNSLERERLLARWSTQIKAEVKSTLLRVGEPRFRWAALQLSEMQNCIDEAEIRETLRNIPQTLERTYERTLTRMPTKNQARVRTILMWLIYSARPLSLEEVAAVADVPFPEDVLRMCTSNLVSTSAGDIWIDNSRTRRCEIVRLAHFSVQEYLCSEKTRNTNVDQQFHMYAKLGHFEIGMRCVKELLKLDQAFGYSPSIQESVYELSDEPDDESDDEPDREPHDEPGDEVYDKLDDQSVRSLHDQHDLAAEVDSSTNSLAQNTKDRSEYLPGFESSLQRLLDRNPLLAYSAPNWSKHAELIQPANSETEALVNLINEFFETEDSPCYANCLCIYDDYWGRFHNGISNVPLERSPPLHCASYYGLVDNTFKLIRQQANVNSEYPKSGWGTALVAASARGHIEIVKLLLKSGADIDLHVSDRFTPLQAACFKSRDKVVTYLLKAGAVVDLVGDNKFEMTALEIACMPRSSTTHNIVADLLEAGADVNRKGYQTALQLACRSHNLGTVVQLLKAGANPNLIGRNRDPPLVVFLKDGYIEMVDQLLEAGANPNSTLPNEYSPLALAVRNGNIEVVDRLLEAGADPNLRGRSQTSPLRLARISDEPGKDRIIQMLIAAGAVEDASDYEDRSSLCQLR